LFVNKSKIRARSEASQNVISGAVLFVFPNNSGDKAQITNPIPAFNAILATKVPAFKYSKLEAKISKLP